MQQTQATLKDYASTQLSGMRDPSYFGTGLDLHAIMARTLDWIGYGIVLVDEHLQPLFANRAARGFLKQGRLRLSSAPTRHRADPLAELRKAIAAEGRGAMATEACRIGEPPLLCTVARLHSRSGAPAAEARAVLFLIDPEQARETQPKALAGFGLTPAEAGFAAEFAKGDRLQECARRLGISQSTARTHLHRIFEKTGAGRQADLMRLILTSTPALRRFDREEHADAVMDA
jgi:DNA-binding CsgD family transcriptional regulator